MGVRCVQKCTEQKMYGKKNVRNKKCTGKKMNASTWAIWAPPLEPIHTFSKVIFLVHFLSNGTIEGTFQNVVCALALSVVWFRLRAV